MQPAYLSACTQKADFVARESNMLGHVDNSRLLPSCGEDKQQLRLWWAISQSSMNVRTTKNAQKYTMRYKPKIHPKKTTQGLCEGRCFGFQRASFPVGLNPIKSTPRTWSWTRCRWAETRKDRKGAVSGFLETIHFLPVHSQDPRWVKVRQTYAPHRRCVLSLATHLGCWGYPILHRQRGDFVSRKQLAWCPCEDVFSRGRRDKEKCINLSFSRFLCNHTLDNSCFAPCLRNVWVSLKRSTLG